MRWMCAIFLLSAMVVLLPAMGLSADWQTCRDAAQGFAFRYPSDYRMKPLTDPAGSLISASLTRGKVAIEITVRNLADYPAEWRAEQHMTTFVNAAVTIARLLCDAAGPDGERECTDVLRQSTFANPQGLECVELELREEVRTYEPAQRAIRTRGPIYAVRVRRTGVPVILFFAFAPEHKPSAAERNLLASIVNSVRTLKEIDD